MKFYLPTFFIAFSLFLAFPNLLKAQAVCGNISVGATPINDLGAGFYMGEQGGLYPGGSNQIPSSHQDLGKTIAAAIQPLNGNGNPDSLNGKIVLTSIGVSNTRNKFVGPSNNETDVTYTNSFKAKADSDPGKNSKVIIVNGAQGGRPLSDWDSSTSTVWTTIDSRLSAAGVTPLQVQAVWVELPNKGYTTVFPASEQSDKEKLENVLRIAKTRYSNLRVAYLSSRSYGGYSTKTDTNIDDESAPGKLHAYQSAWVVKWIIEDQINGAGNLNPDPAKGAVIAPWISWGPYFWADGTTPRSDGLSWLCGDFNADGVHPNNQGVKKVADRLLEQLKTDPTACGWFNKDGCGGGGGPTKTPTPTSKIPTPTQIAGDLDKDGDVDIFDYNILIENFGNTSCGNIADIDGNCKVDIFDYNILVENFGK